MKYNRREERRSGTAGTGVSQKDLQIERKIVLRVSKKEKNARIAKSSWAIFDEIESK